MNLDNVIRRSRPKSTIIDGMFSQVLTIQIVAAVVGVIGMCVDGIVTGSLLAPDCMGAYGIVTPLISIIAAVSTVIGVGVSTVTGRLIGAGDTEKASAVISLGIVFGILLCIVSVPLMILFADRIALLMGATPALMSEAAAYVRGFLPCFPFMILTVLLMPVMQFDSDPNRVFAAIFTMTFVNVVLDFANALVFHKGLFGMAVATTVSYIAAFILLALHFLKKERLFHLSFRHLDWHRLKDILITGFPNCISLVSTALCSAVLIRMLIGSGNTRGVTVLAMLNSGGQLLLVLGQGIGVATQMLAGMFSGEEDTVSLKALLDTSFRRSVILGGIYTAVVLVLAKPFAALFFSGNAESLLVARTAVRFYALGIVPYNLMLAMQSYLRGISSFRIAYSMPLIGNLLLTALYAWLLHCTVGDGLIWLCYVLSYLTTLLLYALYAAGKKHKKLFSPESLMLLPEHFGISPENRFDSVVMSVEDAVHTSEAAIRFCTENGGDSRTGYIIGLVIEEMAKNVVLHGFPRNAGKKGVRSIDISLAYKDGHWLLRIKDNCVMFDPVSYDSLFRSDDPTSHIGIRLAKGMAADFSYLHTMGINHLIVKI